MNRIAGLFALLTVLVLAFPAYAAPINTSARCSSGQTCEIGDSATSAVHIVSDGGTAIHDGASSVIQVGAGADPGATCTVGEVFIDTDESVDTNCTTTADNSLCLCTAADTWTALENN